MNKKLHLIQKKNDQHWVGDGFPVRTLFSYDDLPEELSPFLLLDHAGPAHFPASDHRRGVGEHPHRGFETVTIVYDGEIGHRDSHGGGGIIGSGDVQWMTAASGVVHEEFHSRDFTKKGGPFHVVQLWVNLSAKNKGVSPRYQGITDAQIPRIELPHHAGLVRVIAGNYAGTKGAAQTFSPVNLWDLRVNAGHRIELKVPESFTTALVVLQGEIRLPDGESVHHDELALFEREGDSLKFEAKQDSTLLFLNGQPLEEPVVGYGPFVMNTREEIRQAFEDYQKGRMGYVANLN